MIFDELLCRMREIRASNLQTMSSFLGFRPKTFVNFCSNSLTGLFAFASSRNHTIGLLESMLERRSFTSMPRRLVVHGYERGQVCCRTPRSRMNLQKPVRKPKQTPSFLLWRSKI